MRTVGASLLGHYQGIALTLANCVKITQKNGTVLGFTDHDRDLVVAGVTYRSSVGCKVSTVRFTSAIEEDRFVVEGLMVALSYAVQETTSVVGRLSYGAIDIFEVNWADLTMNTRPIKRGRIAQVTPKGNFYTLECEGLMSVLLRKNMLETYNADCNADFNDVRCGKAPVTHAGVITSIPNSTQIIASAFGGPATPGFFEFGRIDITGAVDITSQIKTYDSGTKTFTLALPLPLIDGAPTIGSSFTAYQGCDRKYATCRDTHNNLSKFRGFPFIPGAQALRGVNVTPDEGA
jgi:uncharacterized phage protein (TIGR02218 family)